MTVHEMAMLSLISLPFAVIGWIGGMIWMRAQYLPVIRGQKRQIRALLRRM